LATNAGCILCSFLHSPTLQIPLWDCHFVPAPAKMTAGRSQMQETAAPWIKAFDSRLQGVPVRRRLTDVGVIAARQGVAFAHAGAHIPVGLLAKDQPFLFVAGRRSRRRYWRLETLKSFDAFLARRFPESRRKAYYLMSIHEHLPPQARKDLKEVGWTKGLELAKVARRDGKEFDCATWLKTRPRFRLRWLVSPSKKAILPTQKRRCSNAKIRSSKSSQPMTN
jgi:hypothetical protein